MSAAQFLALPVGVQIAFALMLFPAIWGAALLIGALVGDLIRQHRIHRSAAERAAA